MLLHWLTNSVAIAALAVLMALLLVWRWRAIHGTTLTGPWGWTLSFYLMVLLGCLGGVDWSSATWAYVFGTASFCPMMALLGAKRPQDKGWPLVVATLWVMLILPAIELLVLRPTEVLALHWVFQLFLAGMILLGVTNLALGRFCVEAVLIGVGQLITLSQHVLYWPLPLHPATGLWVGSLGLAIALIRYLPDRRQLPQQDRWWLDFRDLFGAMWALRVMERVNSVAQSQQLRLTLTWWGFQPAMHAEDGQRLGDADRPEGRDSAESPAIESRDLELIEKAFRSMLWRFVSEPWIAARGGKRLE